MTALAANCRTSRAPPMEVRFHREQLRASDVSSCQRRASAISVVGLKARARPAGEAQCAEAVEDLGSSRVASDLASMREEHFTRREQRIERILNR